MNKLVAFVKKELVEMLPPTIFFLVVFHVVLLVRRFITPDESGFYLTTSATALVGALIIGKAVLVADALPPGRLFLDRRLVYNVLWRTILYMAIALAFQLGEELMPLVSKYGGLGAAVERLGEEIHWPRFWATHAILALFLGLYSLLSGLARAIGVERFTRVLLGPQDGG